MRTQRRPCRGTGDADGPGWARGTAGGAEVVRNRKWTTTVLALIRRLRYGVAMVAQEVIEAAGQTLAAVADDPVKIVLFGSRARGDAGPDSDFDFLVVERDPRDRHAEMVRLGRALRPLGMPFDVVVVSERYADDWGNVEGTMVHAALTEGRVLHAAA